MMSDDKRKGDDGFSRNGENLAILPGRTRIGWIGTGVMGSAMAANLIRAGYSMTVSTRTPSKADSLRALGAKWGETPAEVAVGSDVVFVMVGHPSDVESVILGENGVFAGFQASSDRSEIRKVVVDMTTSRPSLAETIFEKGMSIGVDALDAPVSGGDIGARNGTLSIMIGGLPEVAERLDPLFRVLGKTIVWHGGAGRGQHAKMTNQILIAGNMAGVCEAFLYAFRAGLDMGKVFASVEKGAAGSWSLSNLGPRILRNDFSPGFFVEHFIKDMGIALEEAERMGLDLPALSLVRRLYEKVAAAGGAKKGTQALIQGLASLSDVSLAPYLPNRSFIERGNER